MTDFEKKELLAKIEKQRHVYLRKRIINEALALLFVLAGFVFVLCSFLVTPGSFYLLFFLIGILIILFLPIVFMYQAKSETGKYQAYVLSMVSLSLNGFYETYSFVYKEEEWKLPKENLLKEKTYLPHSVISHHKGRIDGVDFVSLLYTSPERHQHGRLVSYTLDFMIPSEIVILSKKRMYAYRIPEDGLKKDDRYPDHVSFIRDSSVHLDEMVHEMEALEKEYSFDISLVMKDRHCHLYLEGVRSPHPSVHHVFDDNLFKKVVSYLELEGMLEKRLQLEK